MTECADRAVDQHPPSTASRGASASYYSPFPALAEPEFLAEDITSHDVTLSTLAWRFSALSTKAMSAIRPWDCSNPNETILDKRILRSA
jgi:hypothetical protein